MSLNGLTASEIVQRGQAIREKEEQEQIAFRKKRIEDNIGQIKELTATLEQEVESDKKFAEALTQVEIMPDGMEALQAEPYRHEKTPPGVVGSFVVLVTIKNNSLESVKSINGNVIITDMDGNEVDTISLNRLQEADDGSTAYKSNRDLNIFPRVRNARVR